METTCMSEFHEAWYLFGGWAGAGLNHEQQDTRIQKSTKGQM